jgi:CheY-like chemotaxis protein
VTEAPRADGRRDVLIVEDNDDAREALRELLELAGHRVRAERDGPSGIEAARARRPEVVLIDVGLPGIDGYEVARRLRSEGGPRMTLIAVTGYGLPEDRARARGAGFDEHLVKPVDLAALRRVLAL